MRLLAGGLLILLVAGCGGTAAERAERNCRDDGMAFVMSQKFVKNRLKAPSSAQFPSSGTVTKTGECSFRVRAWVDSQNSFGAMLRSDYSAEVTYDAATNKWRAGNVTIVD